MACQINFGSSGEVYLDFMQKAGDFVLLLVLDEKPQHFKFEVKQLNPGEALPRKTGIVTVQMSLVRLSL